MQCESPRNGSWNGNFNEIVTPYESEQYVGKEFRIVATFAISLTFNCAFVQFRDVQNKGCVIVKFF